MKHTNRNYRLIHACGLQKNMNIYIQVIYHQLIIKTHKYLHDYRFKSADSSYTMTKKSTDILNKKSYSYNITTKNRS
jgi:hypothetical protein